MPTLVAMPWPSGPVVVSTPEVQRYSGWPGQRLSSWRKLLMSSSGTDSLTRHLVLGVDRLDPRQVQHRVEQHRRVAHREHEAVAVRPDRVFGVEAKDFVPERVGDRRHRHRRAGVAGVGRLHGVHRQGADRVDAKFFEVNGGLFSFHFETNPLQGVAEEPRAGFTVSAWLVCNAPGARQVN